LIQLLKAEGAEISFTELTAKEEIRNFIDNPAQLSYVAVTKEEPSRALCLVRGRREMTSEKFHAAFLTAATHPEARGLRLAAELTNFALEEMKQEGVNIARIYVYSNNQASLNAVKKLGFVHAGTVLRHHIDQATGEYVDDLIFHKIL
jgi:ribosomal protein S18 acetylase RimI-like enzyme